MHLKMNHGAARGLSALFLAAFLASCTTVPETGRRQFNILSSEQEVQMGLSSFNQMKTDVPLSKDPQLNALVKRVGERIAAVAPLPNAKWEFVVFESEQANAFCLPGGKVGIYTGILSITKDEGGLATVIGHEVAHAVARHGGERVSHAMAVQAGGVAAAILSSNQEPEVQAAVSVAYGLGTQVGHVLPHSRGNESEADHLGILYMARAGYDPENSVAFWQRFADHNRAQGGSTPWFLRTHPLDQTRIDQLRTLMPQAKREYERAAVK